MPSLIHQRPGRTEWACHEGMVLPFSADPAGVVGRDDLLTLANDDAGRSGAPFGLSHSLRYGCR